MRRSPDQRKTKQSPAINPNLNPNYTFENFVVGSCNQFAHAAATAVANNPAKSYNPLYIYGGAGLGKTHLMNAIGHFAIQQSARNKILYVTTEKFMNDLVNHLQYGKVLEFREKYRSVDLLLMDDIHICPAASGPKRNFSTPSTIFTTARNRSSSPATALPRRSPTSRTASGPASSGV
jgi:chromosomal replication initiator protein